MHLSLLHLRCCLWRRHVGSMRGVALDPYSSYSYHKRVVRKQLLWNLCGVLAAGETDIVLGGTGTEIRDWHHVSDFVRLIHRILPDGELRFAIYNSGEGAPAAVRTIPGRVLKAWKGNHSPSFSGKSRRDDAVNLISDPSGVPERLQLQVPLSRGIAGYVVWYRADVLAEPVGHLRRSAS
ncbi:MAG: NAD-dependent epimerase/dehydratase family protein [Mesorhizobium sp.]|nr:MAG: NAD-dependent epimerase/dehydratase family protein [Mesorhizobium sp.]